MIDVTPSNTAQGASPLNSPGVELGEHHFVHVNGVRLHYVEARPVGGATCPLVLLLHGFPEFWYGWRRQIPALVRAGFRVVVPDLRGFNLSSKPPGVAAYGMRHVADDIAQLVEALGAERAHIAGHDFGAGVAWALAMRHPGRVERLAILNGPHPLRFLQALTTSLQVLNSWYMFLFQLPWLPERVLSKDDYALLLQPFVELPERARFSPVDLAAYREALAQPAALPCMLNYYRAIFRPSGAVSPKAIPHDVLVLWGDEDRYLRSELAEPSARWVPRARVEHFPGVGHFIQHERPDVVNAHLVEHFSAL